MGDSDENSLLYKDQNFDDSQDSSLDESDHEYDNYLYQMAGKYIPVRSVLASQYLQLCSDVLLTLSGNR